MINDDIYITGKDNVNEKGELLDENLVYKLIKIDTQTLVSTDSEGNPKQVVNVLLMCVHPSEKTNPSIAIFTPDDSISLGIEDSYYSDDDDDDDEDENE